MRDKERKGFIVPYSLNFGGPIIGDAANNIAGLPLFLSEDPEKEMELDMDEL